jgi:DNA-binding beta-propeller fold protein YncE
MNTVLRILVVAIICIASITVGAQAGPQGALLVVTKQSHALAIVDGATLQVLARVPVGEDPHEVTVGPDGRTAYVSNYGEGTLHTLAVVDLVARKPMSSIDVTPMRGPHGFVVRDGKLWFTAEGSKALALFNFGTRQIDAVLGTGQDRTHMMWLSRDGARILAANAGSGTLSIFDRVEIKPVMAPGAPAPPAAYSTLGWRHTVVPVGMGAEGFDISPDEREAWVGNKDGTISIIDLQTERVAATLAADVPLANRLKFTPDGRFVLVTMKAGKDLAVFDAHTREAVKRIPIEQRGASGILVQPDGKRAFIACPRDHYVAVVDLVGLAFAGKIDAGLEPDGLTWWTY